MILAAVGSILAFLASATWYIQSRCEEDSLVDIFPEFRISVAFVNLVIYLYLALN
jgi:hypothetical protein